MHHTVLSRMVDMNPGAEASGSGLGEIIRRQRELAELSMRQVAAMAGISNPYLSQIERGLRAPSEEVLRAIAESLNVSADLLRGEQPEDASAEAIDAVQSDQDLTASQ